MDDFSCRFQRYSHLSKHLKHLGEEEILTLLKASERTHHGMGGTSSVIKIEGTSVFVKHLPLTHKEQSLASHLSTANIFDLPLYYHYGVGSAGFGVGREISSHLITTDWILRKKCENFPLLYHFCILPQKAPWKCQFVENIDDYLRYWENHPAIHGRILSLKEASSSVAVFLEYVPQTLFQWLKIKLLKSTEAAESAMIFVIKEFHTVLSWLSSKDFLHFDLHFENILCDGERLYVTDFGLANMGKFQLTGDEKEFLNYHKTYDKACFIVNLFHCVSTAFFGKDQYQAVLKNPELFHQTHLSKAMIDLMRGYASIAQLMDTFFQALQKKSKKTPYPYQEIQALLKDLEGCK